MPTLASATVICHLYREPTSGQKDGKTWALFNGWTSDTWKDKQGEKMKAFTSFEGFVNGPPADWLIRDGKKGSMLAVTGAFRVETTEKDGKHSSRVIFTRVTECKVLDGEREQASPQQDNPAPRRAAPAATGKPVDDEPPF